MLKTIVAATALTVLSLRRRRPWPRTSPRRRRLRKPSRRPPPRPIRPRPTARSLSRPRIRTGSPHPAEPLRLAVDGPGISCAARCTIFSTTGSSIRRRLAPRRPRGSITAVICRFIVLSIAVALTWAPFSTLPLPLIAEEGRARTSLRSLTWCAKSRMRTQSRPANDGFEGVERQLNALSLQGWRCASASDLRRLRALGPRARSAQPDAPVGN